MGYRIEQENSLTGDVCHYNIKGLSNRQAKIMFIKLDLETFRICNGCDNCHRPLTIQDVEGQKINLVHPRVD